MVKKRFHCSFAKYSFFKLPEIPPHDEITDSHLSNLQPNMFWLISQRVSWWALWSIYHWALFSESQISSCFSLLRPLGLCELLKQVSADHNCPTVPPRSAEYACSGKRSWPVDLCLVLFLLFSLSECNYVCAIPLPQDRSVVCVPALKDCPASLITLPQPATEDRSIDKEGISGLCGHMCSSDCKRFL